MARNVAIGGRSNSNMFAPSRGSALVGGSSVCRESLRKCQAALEALLLEVFEPFADDPESLAEELDSLLVVLDSLDDEFDFDFSDALARAFEP